MRKLVILCLAVGLALASSEQWIGRSENPHYAIPNPQPGIFPFSPDLFPGTDTLRYDDGTAANAWAQNVAGGGWGVKFISPSDNVTLAGALIHFYSGFPTPGDTLASLRVYADDGPGGSPGTQLFTVDNVKITMGQWNYIPVSTPIVASNFYIFYKQVGAYPNCPGLSIDAANNAPQHRKWAIDASDNFTEDNTYGDWLIRPVLDWTPQDTNAAAVYFATNMVADTVPNINFPIRATIRNLGSDTLPSGTPVRLRITGPNSYDYQDTMLTSAALKHGATSQMNFSPTWHIPPVAGDYLIKVWTAAAGEDWPADDTIAWQMSCANWIEYISEAKLWWISPSGPDKATQFNPANFSLQYPVGLTRVRAEFYLHQNLPWTDSSFQFLVYGDDGATLLYESETLEAPAGTPGAPRAYSFDSTLVFTSGTFYVVVSSVTQNGRPTLISDSCSRGANQHSWYGSAGSWTQNSGAQGGEWFISAVVQGNYGVEEGYEPGLRKPSLQITNYPNPVGDQVTLKWQVPNSMPISVNLYDATGRLIRNLYSANDKARVGTLTMDARSLAAGIYLARLETAKGSATRKLVIDR